MIVRMMMIGTMMRMRMRMRMTMIMMLMVMMTMTMMTMMLTMLELSPARPSWMSISQQQLGYKDRMFRVRLDFLQDVVSLDKEKMTVSVEPNITIGLLNRFLVSQGVTLPVVPELDNLTIGGLVAGGGIESTSHKYGLFHHTATEYEVVVGSGDVVVCNEHQNTDYFHAVPMR